ncbi:unnamed protein product, partial [Ectocarpus sp. 12 AP-2014]
MPAGKQDGMILSVDGVLRVLAAYVNIITLASLLQLSTETTQRFAKFGIVKAAMLFSFAFSVIPDKFPCLVATLLFFIFEVKNFV